MDDEKKKTFIVKVKGKYIKYDFLYVILSEYLTYICSVWDLYVILTIYETMYDFVLYGDHWNYNRFGKKLA